jgi:hypothetical protein
MKEESHTQQSNLAGEFSVLSRLSMEGLIGTLTLGNAKSVDILVLNPITNKMFKLEVKSRFKQGVVKSSQFEKGDAFFAWPRLSAHHEQIIDKNLFYCFVEIADENSLPKYFIVPSEEVAEYVKWENKHWWTKPHKSRKTGKIVSLKESEETGNKNLMRTFRINVNTGTNELYPNKKYLNNWIVFK